MSEVRLPRRRRSATRTPVLVDPADIPEDAEGRVEVLAVRAPADVVDPVDRPAPEAPAQEPSRLVAILLTADGWAAIGVVAAVLLILFIIGMKLTR